MELWKSWDFYSNCSDAILAAKPRELPAKRHFRTWCRILNQTKYVMLYMQFLRFFIQFYRHFSWLIMSRLRFRTFQKISDDISFRSQPELQKWIVVNKKKGSRLTEMRGNFPWGGGGGDFSSYLLVSIRNEPSFWLLLVSFIVLLEISLPTGMVVHLASTDEERTKCFWLQGSDCFISNTGKLRGSARLYYNLMKEQGIYVFFWFIFFFLSAREENGKTT